MQRRKRHYMAIWHRPDGLIWCVESPSKQHVEETPDVPAAPEGAGGHAERMQIGLIRYRFELDRTPRETEDYPNEMPDAPAVFDFDQAPHYSSFYR